MLHFILVGSVGLFVWSCVGLACTVVYGTGLRWSRIVLHCVVLHCAVLCEVVLYCIVCSCRGWPCVNMCMCNCMRTVLYCFESQCVVSL